MSKKVEEKKVVDYPTQIETRVALLEQAIVNINETLKETKSYLKDIKTDMRSDFRWTMTAIIGAYAITLSSSAALFLKFVH